MKKTIIILFVISLFEVAAINSTAQATNASAMEFSDWGPEVHSVQLSIMTTNVIVPSGGELVLNVRMKNSSTNIIFFGESGSEKDFYISLEDHFGKEYQMTQTPWVYSGVMIDALKPGEYRDWIIHLSLGRYFEKAKQHGILPINKNVPAGDYSVKLRRTFSLTKIMQPEFIQANTLNINIRN